MTAYIIGNGTSRKNVDLKQLNGATYGCNALYHDFTPDVLVATDDPISRSIQSSGYAKRNKFYTRKVYAGSGANQLRSNYANWSSGPNALQLAVHDYHDDITLLGFDFGSTGIRLNNLYAGTEFYEKPCSRASYYGNWPHQVQTIMRMADRVEFTVVIGPETCSIVDRFASMDNVKIISIQKFINNVMGTNI